MPAHGHIVDLAQIEVFNKGPSDMRTTQALHTYYRVSDISDVRLEGLQQVPFFDNTDSRRKKDGGAGAVVINGEVDRIYAHGRVLPAHSHCPPFWALLCVAHKLVGTWFLQKTWILCACGLCALFVLATTMGWSNRARWIQCSTTCRIHWCALTARAAFRCPFATVHRRQRDPSSKGGSWHQRFCGHGCLEPMDREGKGFGRFWR